VRRIAIVVLVVGIVAVGLAFALRDRIATRVMERALTRSMAADPFDAFPDGLHVVLCGAGSPLPDPQRAGPCAAVIAGRSLFVVDAGSGGVRNLQRMRLPTGAIEGVLLTHFHSDHIDGLGELGIVRWVSAANTGPLPVHGPPGVEEVVAGFNRAYRLDAGYRTAHHGPTVAPASGAGLRARTFATPADGSPAVVHEAEGLRITAFTVDHRPASPAVGYRFDYAGRSLVISGDTRRSEAVVAAAEGADLLVHEALAPHLVALMNRAATEAGNAVLARITHDIPDYHTSPVEAAQVAREAGVQVLLLHHIVPPLPLPGLDAAFLRGVDEAWDGRVVLGEDGTRVSLPRGERDVIVSGLL
jgi:ribonuclease Z